MALWPWRTSTTTPAPPRAPSRWPSPRRKARCGTWASRATRPSSASASPPGSFTPTPRCGRGRRSWSATCWANRGCGPTGSPAISILLVRVVQGDDIPLVRQVLQAQEYWRLKGLSADVVILNEHPVSYLDEMHVQLTALLDTGPWGAWKHRPGGVYLLRGDRMSEDERTLLASVARVVLSGDRGELSSQLDWPYPEPQWRKAQQLPPRPPLPASGPAGMEIDVPALTFA